MAETPAQRVYDAFGGPMRVVDATGLPIHEVYRWRYPTKRNGCNGLVPHRHQRRLLEAAKKLGIKLKPEALVDVPA